MTMTTWKTGGPGAAAMLGLALAAGPLWAQQPQDGIQDAARQGLPQAANGEAAKHQAEKLGMRNVQETAGTSVLKGTSPTDAELYMIVGPAGELLALAAPLPARPGSAEGSEAQAGSTGSGTGSSTAPAAGEPADAGYMATQAQPATPGMWDPATVESAMRQLELAPRSAAGEVAEN